MTRAYTKVLMYCRNWLDAKPSRLYSLTKIKIKKSKEKKFLYKVIIFAKKKKFPNSKNKFRLIKKNKRLVLNIC